MFLLAERSDGANIFYRFHRGFGGSLQALQMKTTTRYMRINPDQNGLKRYDGDAFISWTKTSFLRALGGVSERACE